MLRLRAIDEIGEYRSASSAVLYNVVQSTFIGPFSASYSNFVFVDRHFENSQKLGIH